MFDVIAGTSELIGIWLLGNKKKFGFICNFFAACCWVYVAFHNQVYGLLIMAVPAIIINIRNYFKWTKESKIEESDLHIGVG
jgi:nicotinamide riboside transporter PnuC